MTPYATFLASKQRGCSGRRGIGIELKPSYWATAVANLREADEQRAIPTLFEATS